MKLYNFTLYDVCLGAYFCVNFPLVEFLEIFRLATRVTPPGNANPCVLVQRFNMDSVMLG